MPAPSSSGEAGAAAERFRSHWWHADHLALMAGRLELGRARRVLDLGCGAGQWAAALAPLLAGDSLLIGLDRSASALQSAGAVRYRVRGDARQLPLADASLDLVTGQTVLMHLDDPGAALAEAYRVLRPGGRVLLAEPLNRLYGVSTFPAERDRPDQERAQRLVQQLRLERHMQAAGAGDLSVPERLCPLIEAIGYEYLQVHQSDRVHYLGCDAADDPEVAPLVATIRHLASESALLDSFAPLLRALPAGQRSEVESGLRAEQARCARLCEELDARRPLGLFAMHLFLVSARRPADAGR